MFSSLAKVIQSIRIFILYYISININIVFVNDKNTHICPIVSRVNTYH